MPPEHEAAGSNPAGRAIWWWQDEKGFERVHKHEKAGDRQRETPSEDGWEFR